MTTDKAMVTEEVMEAAMIVLRSWDDRMPDGPEKLQTLDGFPEHKYWSPSASMVSSEAMATLRTALSSLTLERGEAEPVAAMVVDHTGCEHMSRDIAQIERIAADCGERPTYLYSTLSKRGEAGETRSDQSCGCEGAGNDDDAIMYPQKTHRDTVARIVEAHNAAITTGVKDDDPCPGEHQEVLDAINSHNSGEEE